jgi:hypothetical protein
MSTKDYTNPTELNGAAVSSVSGLFENCAAEGHYHVECFDKDGNLKWADDIENVVCTDGKNAAFQAIFKASAFTSTVYMGLIGNVTYTAPTLATYTAAAINTAGSANSWNEAAATTCAARQAPSFAVPSLGAVALSTARTFSMLATDTINGCFVLITSVALVAPVATVGSTAGALWSAGQFNGGAKTVASGDTLNVSYSASM